MTVYTPYPSGSDVLRAIIFDWAHAAWSSLAFIMAIMAAAVGRGAIFAIRFESFLLISLCIVFVSGLLVTVLLLEPPGWLLGIASCFGLCMGIGLSSMYYQNVKSKEESCLLVRKNLHDFGGRYAVLHLDIIMCFYIYVFTVCNALPLNLVTT